MKEKIYSLFLNSNDLSWQQILNNITICWNMAGLSQHQEFYSTCSMVHLSYQEHLAYLRKSLLSLSEDMIPII